MIQILFNATKLQTAIDFVFQSITRQSLLCLKILKRASFETDDSLMRHWLYDIQIFSNAV